MSREVLDVFHQWVKNQAEETEIKAKNLKRLMSLIESKLKKGDDDEGPSDSSSDDNDGSDGSEDDGSESKPTKKSGKSAPEKKSGKGKPAPKEDEDGDGDEDSEASDKEDEDAFNALGQDDDDGETVTCDMVRAAIVPLAKKSEKAADAAKALVTKFSKDGSHNLKKVPEKKLKELLAEVQKLAKKFK